MKYGRTSRHACGGVVPVCVLLSCVLALMSGCGDDVSPTAPTPPQGTGNRPPSAAGSVPDQAVTVSGTAAMVNMAPYFTDPDGDALTYSAVSSNAAVVTTSVSGSTVMLTPVSAGAATTTVTARDLGGLTATQSVAVTVDVGDAHGSTRDAAVPVGSASDTAASLDTQGDVDYFSLDISASAALTVETTGGADTFGQLESQDGLIIASADVGGSGGNFRIERQIPAATYYVRVSGATRNVTGPYMLLVRTSDATPPGPRSQGAPDLTVYAVSVATNPSGTSPGGSFTLSAGVRNDGDAASAATTLRYYRSTDATITTADTSVGTDAVGGLAAAATSSESIDLTAPAAAGTYYYGACVEAVAGESDATNNCSPSVQVSVTEVRAETHPDLAVGSPSVSDSSPTSGATFTLSAAVRNDGDGAAAATTLHYYRSTDATITTADTSVGTDAVGGLAAAATSSESIDLTAPAAAGTYYYGACVDAVAGESAATNNCSPSVQVSVTEVRAETHPDLAVGSPSVSDSSPTSGATFTLSAAVRNDGDGAAAATTLRYYRSTDATITTADTSVGTDAVGGLAAAATSSESIDLTAPSAPGTSYYGACVDAVTGESDTTNNCSSAVSVTVSAPPPPLPAGPDLTVHGIVTVTSLDGTPPGGSFQLGAAVENQGDEPSAVTTLRYYQSTDATITPSDTEVGTDTVGGLSAGATTRIVTDVTAPASAGTYYYGACVDAVTGESDTTNNCSGSVSVVVSESPPQTNPDLAVGSPSVSDSSPTSGATFTLSATVRNDGDGAAAATTLRYYRSTDGTITTSDTSVGTDAVGGLSAGATSPESISLTAPSSAGTSYYGACVDTVTGESDTTNNCSSAVSVTVSAPPPPPPPQTNPDLEVQSPSVNDSSLDTGDSFTLSATVRNDGDGAAAATTLRYYRSTDGTITTSDTSVGTDAVGGLSAGATSPESISLTAPSSAGTSYYGACVDTVTGESDTTNNCSSAVSVTVSAPPPPPPPQTNPDLAVGVALRSATAAWTTGGYIHPVGDGAQRRRRRRGGDDAALLPVDRRDDYDLRHLGGHGRGGGAFRRGDEPRVDQPDGAVVGGHVLLRRVRGHGDGRVGHDEQLLECRVGHCVGAPAPAPAADQPGPGGAVALGERQQPGYRRLVHPVGDGAQRRRRRRGGDDAALLPVDRRDDYDLRHLGGHGRGGGAFRRGDEPRVDQPDGAVVGGHVLLRRVRGHGDGRVGHDEQLLECRVGHCVGAPAPAPAADQPGPGGAVALGERQQPGYRRLVHPVGDGAQRRRRRRGGDDAALLPVDRRDDYDLRHLGGHGRGGGAFRRGDEPRVDQPDGAVVGGHVLLRRVRGHGDGRVGHDEQLLECRVGHCVGAPAPAPAADQPGPGGAVALGERQQPGYRRLVHPVGDGAQRRRRRRGGDDAALLPVDRRDDYDLRHLGGHGRGGGAFRRGDEPRVDQPDGAVVGGHVLLRRVRGHGDGRVGHDEQLLECRSVTVSAPPPPPPPQTNPDLEVQSPSVNDSSLDTGDSFTLSATVRNDGDGAAAATTLRYYRSTDGTITTSDTSVGTDAVGGLSAGATSPESISLTAPSSAGTSYYGACVDTVTGESDTTNNCSSAVSVTVSAPPPPPPPPPPAGPDLMVHGIITVTSLDGTPPGGSFQLGASVRNDGDESSAATTLRYYHSTDATITTSDTEVGTDTVGGLSAGATTRIVTDVTAPASAGTYYYGLCVDAVTGESDTTNNCSGSASVEVTE